jgi:hypothetical protein
MNLKPERKKEVDPDTNEHEDHEEEHHRNTLRQSFGAKIFFEPI